MRRHFKEAFSVGSDVSSSEPAHSHHGRLWGRSTASLPALFIIAILLSAAPAPAAVITDRPLLFSFDGADTTAGRLVKPNKIAIDNSSGYVYVTEGEDGPNWDTNNVVSKFNPDGTAANFSATGTSSLFGVPSGSFGARLGIAVDNSGGPNQGRIYVTDPDKKRLVALAPDGAFLWETELGYQPLDVAVDSAGHPLLLLSDQSVREYANSGSPPTEIDSFTISGFNGLDVDAVGNVYVASFSGVRKYVGGAFDSVLDPALSNDVYADQSSVGGHIFVVHVSTADFNEYDSSGSLVGTFGNGAIDAAAGIAYSKALDRAYVGNRGLSILEAFGPPLTGTIPDPTSEAPTVTGPGTATFHGTVNPQGVANAYYFEWMGEVELSPFTNDSGRYFRSPLQSLPEDSSPHAVEHKATNVSGNNNWWVRLVVLNTANGLRQVSNITAFKPPKATQGPTVAIDPVGAEPTPPCTTGITPTSACVSGTINPREDSVRWRLEYTTDPECSNSWNLGMINYLPGGEVDTPLDVSFTLKGLQPSQRYCVRLRANNSFDPFGAGSLTEIEEFTTPALPPSEVQTAFAAPRTDTTARINGRVNPRGSADLTYRFEWSEDGSTWTQLPIRESSVDSQVSIVVSDELSGLKPDATYHYRLAFAENETGPATEIGEGKTFRTRTSAEMSLPPSALGKPGRGIELVNNPDKGNQNVFFFGALRVPFISPNGERALWSVTAGAPGSPSGVGGQFLAERTASGWQSRSLEPPVAQQFGNGKLIYRIEAGTPDLSRFTVDMRGTGLLSPPEATVARLDDDQHEEVLGTYSWSETSTELTGLDATEDGAHVVLIRPETRQLEDVGDGTPEIVSLMPDGSPSGCGLLGGSSFTGGSPFGEVFGEGGVKYQQRRGYHMMDTVDASLVYFEAKPNGECSAPWGLYVRDREAEETILIDPGTEGKHSEFIRATPDGRHGYFLTPSKLDPADVNSGGDLYRWDQESEESSCLTCMVPNAAIKLANPAMVSDDFSHAYFESPKQLVAGQGVPGGHNVYALSGGTIRFVATLIGLRALGESNAKLSADGNALLFASASSLQLTADEVAAGQGQLYRYDDRDASLECISCLRGGASSNSAGGAELSSDGNTVAFTTKDGLLPLDVNNDTDIYEWRNGSRRLITDGLSEAQTGTAAPGVRGIDADGSNILFSVAQPGLTGFERDELANLYVARIGGGFEPSSPPVHCVEDSCQGPLIAPPSLEQPASAGFSGRGNERSGGKPRRPCAKKRGKAKRRCIRRHKRRSQKARANHDAGRAK